MQGCTLPSDAILPVYTIPAVLVVHAVLLQLFYKLFQQVYYKMQGVQFILKITSLNGSLSCMLLTKHLNDNSLHIQPLFILRSPTYLPNQFQLQISHQHLDMHLTKLFWLTQSLCTCLSLCMCEIQIATSYSVMTSAPVDQMVMVVHIYIVHRFQTKSDGSLPFFVLLMITTQVLYSATDPSNRVHQGTH